MDRADDRSASTAGKTSVGRKIRRGVIIGGLVLVVVYAFLVATAGGHNLLDTVAELDPTLLIFPLLATFFSYIMMSLSYEGITRAAGSDIRSWDMLRITFVANTANYVLPTGGLSGFALRMVMLTKKGIGTGRAVLISFTQMLLTNLMLMVFIVYGLVHLLFTHKMTPFTISAVAAVVSLLTAFLGLCFVMVYRRSTRARLLERAVALVERGLKRFGRYERHGRRVRRFFVHIQDGMEFFASEPRAMVAPLFWIFLDWVCTIGVLYAAFYSVGISITYSQVVIGFSVAIVAAVVSFVPGGVGVLEGSLALTFKSLGIPLEQSVLPIFIFRMCFYVIPAFLSLLLARGAFAEVEASVGEEAL